MVGLVPAMTMSGPSPSKGIVPAPHPSAPPDHPVARPLHQEAPRLVESEQLFQGRKSIQIEHNGTVYHLRATRQGKLILTK